MVKKINYRSSCYLCGGKKFTKLSVVKDYEYFTSTNEYIYYQCVNCDLVFLDNASELDLKIIYPKNYYSYLNRKSLFRQFLEKIKFFTDKFFFKSILKQIKKNKIDVLDVGGGTGFILDTFKDVDYRVNMTYEVDFDDKAGEIARSKGHNYIKSNIENCKINIKFDVIIIFNLIEHVIDPVRVMKKLKKFSNKNSFILIKTPCTSSLNFKVFKKLYWGGYHAPRHFFLFNKNNFGLLLNKSGFFNFKFHHTQGAPQWTYSIIGSFRKILKINSKKNPTFLISFLMLIFAFFDFALKKFFDTDQFFVIINNTDKK